MLKTKCFYAINVTSCLDICPRIELNAKEMETIECYSIVPCIFPRTRIQRTRFVCTIYIRSHVWPYTVFSITPYRPCVLLFFWFDSALCVCPNVFLYLALSKILYIQTTLRRPSTIITHHTAQILLAIYLVIAYSPRSYPKMRAVTKYFSVNQSCWIICESFGTSRLLYISLFLRVSGPSSHPHTQTSIYIFSYIF